MGTGVMGRDVDMDRGCGDGVLMGTVFTGMCRDGVQFLSPCRPLLQCNKQRASQDWSTQEQKR